MCSKVLFFVALSTAHVLPFGAKADARNVFNQRAGSLCHAIAASRVYL